MRLKMPKVISVPRIAEERSEDRCWGRSHALVSVICG